LLNEGKKRIGKQNENENLNTGLGDYGTSIRLNGITSVRWDWKRSGNENVLDEGK